VIIDGGAGSNTLVGPNIANNWHIAASDAGRVHNVKFTRIGSLTGGSRADTFKPGNGVNLSGHLNGGSGVNTLDLSAQKRDVGVDLRTGAATGIAGGVTNIANVSGGKAASILVGDANANTLTGGSGRNIMIGGDGVDQIIGGASENILIGGDVSEDLTLAALGAVMSEFGRSDEDYITRLTHIMSGDGTNELALLNAGTVQGDGVANVLTGGAGRNWFFVADGIDQIKAQTLHKNDVVTKL
jgi:Ca2+-binding RTX toxin-like protein